MPVVESMTPAEVEVFHQLRRAQATTRNGGMGLSAQRRAGGTLMMKTVAEAKRLVASGE